MKRAVLFFCYFAICGVVCVVTGRLAAKALHDHETLPLWAAPVAVGVFGITALVSAFRIYAISIADVGSLTTLQLLVFALVGSVGFWTLGRLFDVW